MKRSLTTKTTAVITTAAMLMSMTACGGSTSTEAPAADADTTQATATEDTAADSEETPEESTEETAE